MKKFILGTLLLGFSLSTISCSVDEGNYKENTNSNEELLNLKTGDTAVTDTGGQDGNLPTNP